MNRSEMIRKKINDHGIKATFLAKKMGISMSTFYRKMNKDGESFTVGELRVLAIALSFSPEEVNSFVLLEK